MRAVLLATACAVAAMACGRSATIALPAELTLESLAFAGEYNIPPLTRFPPVVGLRFGGISGLAPLGGGQWLAVCDEGEGSRVYRLRISGEGPTLRVTAEDVIALEVGGRAPAKVDGEAIVLTMDRTMIVASEGIGDEQPRVAPALLEYDMDGRFMRQLELRDRFVPNPTAALTRGARGNAAFESLTIAPGGGRLFTALETAIVQDGESAAIGRGTVARILEYVREKGTYVPAREFAYGVEPVEPAPFAAAVTVSGLVELLALNDDDQLLAMERTYIAEKRGADAATRSLNRIRLYRVSLAGATDLSEVDSVAGATFRPVTKTLLLDLSNVKGLSPELATLENFEGLAVGPRLADGSRSLLLVSDDNFHETQRTSFLLFRIAGRN